MTELHARPLQGFLPKLIGLIGAREIQPVYFSTRWGIHTFGVRFPIDVLILDDARRIVKMVVSLPPGRIFLWPPRYQLVVELPAGEIKKHALALHTQITLVPVA